jgi:DNA-binding transcriptional ArsR family regulator
MSPPDAVSARARAAAPLFAALGDPLRLRLVARLSEDGPGSIARLSRRAPVSRQAVTKHLRVLARAGLVRGARRGREHVWELRPERLADARVQLDWISRRWDETLDRLRRHLEGPE